MDKMWRENSHHILSNINYAQARILGGFAVKIFVVRKNPGITDK